MIQQQHGFTSVKRVLQQLVFPLDHSPLLFPAHAFPLSPNSLHVSKLALPLSLIFVGSFSYFCIYAEKILFDEFESYCIFICKYLVIDDILRPIKNFLNPFRFFFFYLIFQIYKTQAEQINRADSAHFSLLPILTGLCTLDTIVYQNRVQF